MTQQFEKIILGKTTESEAVEIVGVPYKIEEKDQSRLLNYNSKYTDNADFLYLEKDIVVLKSQLVGIEQKPIKQYLETLSKPEAVVGKVANGKRDVLKTTIYIWPQQGKTIVVYGESEANIASRLIEYQPMSLKEYFSNTGKDFKDYQPVTTLETRISQITNPATPSASTQLPQQFLPPNIGQLFPWILLGLGIVVFTLGLVRFIRNRRKKTPQIPF